MSISCWKKSSVYVCMRTHTTCIIMCVYIHTCIVVCVWTCIHMELDFPGVTGKEPACQCRRCKRHGFDPCVRKILWRGEWLPTSVLSGEFHSSGEKNLVATVHGITRAGHDWSNWVHIYTVMYGLSSTQLKRLSTHAHAHTHTAVYIENLLPVYQLTGQIRCPWKVIKWYLKLWTKKQPNTKLIK